MPEVCSEEEAGSSSSSTPAQSSSNPSGAGDFAAHSWAPQAGRHSARSHTQPASGTCSSAQPQSQGRDLYQSAPCTSKHLQRPDRRHAQRFFTCSLLCEDQRFNTSPARSYIQADAGECPLNSPRNPSHLMLLFGMPHTASPHRRSPHARREQSASQQLRRLFLGPSESHLSTEAPRPARRGSWPCCSAERAQLPLGWRNCSVTA